MDMDKLSRYKSRAARALVLLHERQLSDFMPVWRQAYAVRVPLPKTDDPNYASLETLACHVLRAARGYMTWLCEKLDLPDPAINPTPEPESVAAVAGPYLSHLLERWRVPLAQVEDTRLDEIHVTRWGMQESVENMLEHAVVHPMRHAFQLSELLHAARTA
jgi:uncharacterized damage-inducible protein DinB